MVNLVLYGLKAKRLIEQFNLPLDQEITVSATLHYKTVEGRDKLELSFSE